jgi:hypothetical protein
MQADKQMDGLYRQMMGHLVGEQTDRQIRQADGQVGSLA